MMTFRQIDERLSIFLLGLALPLVCSGHLQTLGNPADRSTVHALDQCLHNTSITDSYLQDFGVVPGFQAGRCPALVDCMLSNLREVDKAGMAAAVSIAALIPTVLAFVGAEPSELIRLAFLSPTRALCTCLFGVGLPSNLFAKLQRHTDSASNSLGLPRPHAPDPGLGFRLAFSLTVAPRRRRTTAVRIALDCLIVSLAAIMLWRNWRIGTMVIVTWRCEYRWLLFFWPVACAVWILLAVGSLLAMSKIEVVWESDGRREKSWWIAFFKPYSPRAHENNIAGKTTKEGGDPHVKVAGPGLSNSVSSVEFDDDRRLTLYLTIPSELHWRWWNTAIQALAVGIYLYATFVLASMLFLTGNEAIVHATVMILCLTAIRIISSFL